MAVNQDMASNNGAGIQRFTLSGLNTIAYGRNLSFKPDYLEFLCPFFAL